MAVEVGNPTCPQCGSATNALAGGRFECTKFNCLHQFDTAPTADKPPKCPRCGTVSTKLSFDGYGAVWRCVKGRCGHEFRVVAGRVIGETQATASRVPEPEAVIRETDQEKPMPNNGLFVCRKGCGKKFSMDAWLKKHEANCAGQPKNFKAAGRGPRVRPRSLADVSGSAISGCIEELRTRHEELMAEAKKLTDAITVLEGLTR